MEPIVTLPVAMAEQERDATGLTDRAYLDVLGRCVSAAIVTWFLLDLATLGTGALSLTAAVLFFGVVIYLASWTTELLRQTFVYADTWRYGGIV